MRLKHFQIPSLIKPLAIRLSPQAGKSLVIPRKRESSKKIEFGETDKEEGIVSLREICLINWIPAFAGMTW